MLTETEKLVPTILSTCYKTCFTGILTIKSGSTIKTLHFDTGDLVFATSNIKEERLGEQLVEKNILSLDKVNAANELVEQYQTRLDQILIKMNYISEERLRTFLSKYIVDIVHSILLSNNIIYEFNHSRLLDYEFKVTLSTPQVLLEAMRYLEDLSLAKILIKNLDFPLFFAEEPKILFHILNLTPQEYTLLLHIEKKPGVTVRKVLEAKVVSEAITLKTLAVLTQTGLISDSNSKCEISIGFDTKTVLDFFYAVEMKITSINQNDTHYALLEVGVNATPAELIDGYTKLIKRFHPDSQAQLNEYNLNLHSDLEKIFNQLTQSIQLLSNPQTKKDYDQKIGLQPKQIPSNQPVGTINKQQAMQFFYELESKLNSIRSGATYYQILEVEWDVSSQQIIEAYWHLLERFNLKKQEQLSVLGINAKLQLDEVNKAVNKAVEILGNNTERNLYNQQLNQQLRQQVNKTELQTVKPSTNQSVNNNVAKNFSEKPKPSANQNPPLDTSYRFRPSKQTNENNLTNQSFPNTISSLSAKPYNQNETLSTNTISNQTKMGKTDVVKNDSKQSETPENKLRVDDSIKYQLPKTNNSSFSGNNRVPTAIDFYLRGIEFYDRQQYEQSVTILRKAVALAPNEAEYWAQLGKAYSKIPDSERQAESAFQEAIDLDPNNSNYPLLLGLFYQKLALIDQAEECFKTVLEIEPTNLNAKRALTTLMKTETKGKSGLLKFISKMINVDE